MSNGERLYTKEKPKKVETFEPQAVALESFPDSVVALVEGSRENLFLGDEKQPILTEPRLVQHADGSRTYIVSAVRLEHDDYSRREATYFVDVVGEEITGNGEVWFDREVIDKPYVGRLFTSESMRGKGYAARRLEIMRRITETKHHDALYSGQVQTPEARALWAGLVESGIAEKTGEYLKHDEFRLKSTPITTI